MTGRTLGAYRYWQREAEALGWYSEQEMWEYRYRMFKTAQLAQEHDVSTFCIRQRVKRCGIELRGPGGANHVKGAEAP